MVKCTVGFLQMAGQMFGWVLTLFMRSLPKQLALKPSICWMHTRQASSPLTLLVKRGTFASSLSHQREQAQKQRRPGWPVLKQAHRLYAQSQQWLPAVTAARLSLHCLVQRPPCQISHSSKCPCGSVKWPQCLLSGDSLPLSPSTSQEELASREALRSKKGPRRWSLHDGGVK